MITFSFLTLFPELILPYFQSSIMKKACDKNLININTINIRDFSNNAYKKVDEKLIGGGAGMLMEAGTLHRAIKSIQNARVIFLSPVGAKFSTKDCNRLAKYSHLAFVCARYEGFDERSVEIDATEVFSVCDFILSGAELCALSMADGIMRQIDGVLGNEDSKKNESFESNLLQAPNFANSKDTNNDIVFKDFAPPLCYFNGNHAKITDLKSNLSKLKTKYFRIDLYENIKKA